MPSKSLGTLTLDLIAKVGGFESGMNKAERTAKKRLNNIKREARKTSRAVQSAFAAIGAAVTVRGIVQATITQENAIKQLQATLISTNNAVGISLDELKEKASALQNVTTFGDEEILKAQSQLATFTKITGQEFEAATLAALDLSAKMGTNLKDSVLQVGKALNDPIKGITALSRSGIQFSEDQKQVVKSLVETGRIADAQKIILKELEVQFGGSAKAARQTLGGALESLQNAFGDLLEADSLPGVVENIEELTQMLSDPQTVENAKALTNAIIVGMTNAAKAISKTIELVSFLGEEIARRIGGAAIGDLVGLERQLDRQLEERRKLSNARNTEAIRQRRKELDEEIAKTKQAIALTKEFAENKRKAAKIPKQTVAGGVSGVVGGTGKDTDTDDQKKVDNVINLADGYVRLADALKQVGLVAKDAAEYTDKINSQAVGIQRELMSDEEKIEDSYNRRRDIILANTKITGEAQAELLKKLETDKNEQLKALENARMMSQLSNAENLFGSLAGLAKTFAGEQSGIYKAMFATEKAISIPRSIVAIQTGIAEAAANPWPANLAAMANVAAATASIVSTIQSTSVEGVAHDGLMSVPKTGTYLLEKGERVTTEKTSAKLDRKLDSMRAQPQSSGGDAGIRINNMIDPKFVGDYMSGPAGDRVIDNYIDRNQTKLARLAGGRR